MKHLLHVQSAAMALTTAHLLLTLYVYSYCISAHNDMTVTHQALDTLPYDDIFSVLSASLHVQRTTGMLPSSRAGSW